MAIYEKCPHDELTIIMRRYMMKIAEDLGKSSGCQGLVTGESIGQVASQTMASLYCTNEVCTMLSSSMRLTLTELLRSFTRQQLRQQKKS